MLERLAAAAETQAGQIGAERCAELPYLEGIDIMPFHRLGDSNRRRLGLDPAPGLPETEPDDTARAGWEARLRSVGLPVVRP